MADDDLRCAEFVETVTAYMEGALPADVVRRIDEHLAICPPCRDYLEQMRLTVSRLGTLPPEPVSASVRRSLLVAFQSWKAERPNGEDGS
jgi:anti-sigma factor RsiW